MKKLALGLLLSFAVSGAAVAADMAPRYTKAPPIVSPATNWSGFYIGAMGGYASENSSDDFVVPGVTAPRMKGGFGAVRSATTGRPASSCSASRRTPPLPTSMPA